MTDDQQRPDQQPAEPGQPAAPEQERDTASFGDPRVDAAVARTDGLDERSVDEHVEVFDDVHRSFRDALDDPGNGA